MNPPANNLYTASQIARAALITRQAAHAGLGSIAPAGRVSSQGADVAGWRFDDLPLDWQLEITRRGVQRGFADGEDFLSKLPEPWICPLPWSQVPGGQQDKADWLQKALARALDLRAAGVKGAELERVGMEDYKAAFGYPLKNARHWRRLLRRTVERDAGEGNWQRMELYLDDKAFEAPSVKLGVVRNEFQHGELGEAIGALKDRQHPTPENRQFVWREALRHYKELEDTVAGSPERSRECRLLKASVLSYLHKAFPALAATLSSLRKRFNEKLGVWRSQGFTPRGLEDAIQDKRPDRSGKFRGIPFESDLPTIHARAELLKGDFVRALTELIAEEKVSNYAGDLLAILRGAIGFEKLSPAYRELREQGRLSKELCAFYPFSARRDKSAVPKAIRKCVQPLLDAALIWKHGPHRARIISPCVRRDWSDTAPGDSTVYDDATPDHTTYGTVELPEAYDYDPQAGLYIGRMEALFAHDERTDKPKAYVIILGEPESGTAPAQKAHYNMVHQRLLMLREHNKLGLPHNWFKLENGPWRNRLNDGEKMQHWENLDYVNWANGLQNATGRTVRHTGAGNPRSKIIERIFGSVWARTKRHRGYIGNSERYDRREVTQDFIRRCKAGKEDPANGLLSVSEYRDVLDAELTAFADEIQNGHRLIDRSPNDAWRNGIDGNPGVGPAHPLEQLPDSALWLFASHGRMEKVKVSGKNAGGITFHIGPTPYYFWGPELENYQNETLLCRFNFLEPGLLCCQDRDGKRFTVKENASLANTEPTESLAQTARARSSWMRRGKLTYDNLPHEVISTVVRDLNYSREVHEIGQESNRDLAKFKVEKTATERKQRRVQSKAAALGFSRELAARHPERVLLADEMHREVARLRKQEVQEEIE